MCMYVYTGMYHNKGLTPGKNPDIYVATTQPIQLEGFKLLYDLEGIIHGLLVCTHTLLKYVHTVLT